MDRILLIEDDPGHRLLIEDRLRRTGFDVSGCGSLADARRRLSSERWDAVVVDQMLPDGEGTDLVSELRRGAPALPVILVTAVSGEEIVVRALRGGVDDYLTKDVALAYLDAIPMALRRQLERARLRRAHEVLEARLRQREKSEAFLSMMLGLADKLNNRLAGTLGYLELAQQELGSEPCALHGHVQRAREAAQRAADILRTLLQYTIGLGEVEVRPIPVEDLLRPLRARYPEACPPVEALRRLPVPTACDQIGEALVGMVRNAEEASGGGEGVRVDAAASADGRWIELRVTDRGEGIPAENLPRVMLPFFTTRGTRAAGLGLWSAFQVVSHAGGRMSISSQAGEGTTVRLELAVARSPETDGGEIAL